MMCLCNCIRFRNMVMFWYLKFFFEHEVHINNAPVQSQTIQKPVGRWSNCWNSFVFIDGTDVDPKLRRVQCKHCKKATYRGYSGNGTSNMNKHLKKCKPYLEFLKTNGEIPQFMQTRFRELLSRAIVRHGYTFSWVAKGKLFREYMPKGSNNSTEASSFTSKILTLKIHGMSK